MSPFIALALSMSRHGNLFRDIISLATSALAIKRVSLALRFEQVYLMLYFSHSLKERLFSSSSERSSGTHLNPWQKDFESATNLSYKFPGECELVLEVSDVIAKKSRAFLHLTSYLYILGYPKARIYHQEAFMLPVDLYSYVGLEQQLLISVTDKEWQVSGGILKNIREFSSCLRVVSSDLGDRLLVVLALQYI